VKRINVENRVRKIRESKMMSKAELARKTGLSVQTVDRIEKGFMCRLDTKRKILLALGMNLEDRNSVFNDDIE
jgi:DNA-binding XRE family transcriptional regulator